MPPMPGLSGAAPAEHTGMTQQMQEVHVVDGDAQAIDSRVSASHAPAAEPAASAPRPGVAAPERLWCPVPGCLAADRATNSGWQTMQGLRPHIDMHCLGLLPGRPAEAWMAAGNWAICTECSRLVSRRCMGGMHRKCAGRRLQRMGGTQAPDESERDVPNLPSLDEIFMKECGTREFLGEGLLQLAEREFGQCLARVVQFNRIDAWDHEVDGQDTPERSRARRAWLELFMFHKACTPALPGGKAKKQRNRNIIATKLERWAAGERASLWNEVEEPRQSTAKPTNSESKRQAAAVAFARRGLPAKAVSRLVDPGLAPDTADVEMIMRSKFVDPPAWQASSFRPPPPAANELSEECVVDAARSFARGAGPGRSGCRPDFVQ